MSVRVADVARAIDLSYPTRRARSRRRLSVIARALGAPADSGSTRRIIEGLVERLDTPDTADMWLLISVLDSRMPFRDDVIEGVRLARLEGLQSVIRRYLAPTLLRRSIPIDVDGDVEVVSDAVVVDVDHTSTVAFATGIQRVVRHTVSRWVESNDVVLVGWTEDRTAFRRLRPDEIEMVLTGTRSSEPPPPTRRLEIVVPQRGVYLLPELNIDGRATPRIGAMAELSSTRTGVIGYDTVPLSSAETSDWMVSGGFASNLAAVKHMDRVATISEAAGSEYRGWREMLAGSGLVGPDVRAIPLANEPAAVDSDPQAVESELGLLPDLPLVLCVGSHEPRKNHLAVLNAAETLWSEGLRFQLLFVGGNAWNSGAFTASLGELAERGRPVGNQIALSDRLLAGAYRRARFTVFPSLNEGYGLPVVESLAVGTPVLTSDFGSMAEITRTGGAVRVDPRSDESIANGMRTLLTDDTALAELQEQSALLPQRDWDGYAADVWQYLVHG